MTKEQIKNYVVTEFIPDGKVEDLADDLNLIKNNIIDSLGFLKLVAHIENVNQITIDVDEIDFEHFSTVNRIFELISSKKSDN